MNMDRERGYQKLLGVLDSLGLTEGNRKLAEDYLEPDKEEDAALLDKAEHQDFSGQNSFDESWDYVQHLQKRGRAEELGRYVRFIAAVGGASGLRPLSRYRWNSEIAGVKDYLSPVQQTAFRAESAIENQYGLSRYQLNNLYTEGKKSPETVLKAIDLCWHKDFDNTKLLLAAVYLYSVQPSTPRAEKTGLLQGLFSRKDAGKEEDGVGRALKIVEEVLENNFGGLFMQGQLSAEETELLKNYVEGKKNGVPGAGGADSESSMPPEVLAACSGKTVSPYLTRLLGGAAFLSIEHTKKALRFLQLAMAADMKTAMDAFLDMLPEGWLQKHMELLEKFPAVSVRKDYIAWCLHSFEKNSSLPIALGRMAQKYPEEIKGVLSTANTKEHQVLMEQVKRGNPALYRQLQASDKVDFRDKVVKELTGWCKTAGLQELQGYLLGEEELEAILPYAADWAADKNWYRYSNTITSLLTRLRDSDDVQMFHRALAVEALRACGGFFVRCGLRRKTPYNYAREIPLDEIREILQVFEEERLPMHYQLSALESIHESYYYYNEKSKVKFLNDAVIALAAKKEAHGEDFVREAKEGSVIVRQLCVRVLDVYWQEYKEALLSCAADSSSQVREIIAAVYGSHKEWEPEILAMLASKKSQEREMAVLTLKKWGAESYRGELEKALELEKSKKLKSLIAQCLGATPEEEAAAAPQAQTIDQLVKEVLKGGKKRKVAWAYETPFTEVHRTDGQLAGEEHLQALLVSYADMNIPGVNADAGKLAAGLNTEELSAFMDQLFGKWLESGAEAKKKWVLYAVSIHGGERVVPVLYHQIQEWPQNARGAMAAEAVKALALNSSSQALLLVDQISRKFKFRQVKTAAGEALSYAAEQLGISREELEDRIVPNLGFNERMEQTFDYGERKFRVYLNPSLELEVFDGDGKKLKSLPAPGKKDDEEKAKAASDAFKLMKKQLKTVVANQKLRLEQALSVERLWPVSKWQELFVNNPVMHQFAIGLIWGLYEEETLKATFRYMEDGSFNTVDEEEYELPEEGKIGLVHPIELDEESLGAWKEQLSDYEVVQPIEQLERTVYRVTEEEKGHTEMIRFGGKVLNGLSLSGKLFGMGWYRGSVLDAGCYYNFYREDGEIGVELEFSGVSVGYENEEVTVYEAVFYRPGHVKRGSYLYDTIKEEDQLKLEEIKPRYFSEMVLQLAKATASSQEQLDYPECKKLG